MPMPKPKPYEPFEHTADVGVRVHGDTLAALLENAALALADTMVGLDRVEPRREQQITVAASDLEELVVNWLTELLYLFEVEGLVFADFTVTDVSPEGLTAKARGESFDPDRHPIAADIKAVTYHQLQVEEVDGRWQVSIVFDV